jgi:wyosine [tRNA(Phe)-imidazoG37] synthetase (radical SAM superfamily)
MQPVMALNAISPVYGPVSSRRLGRSLGVDLVPFKTCTYDCIYCQLGHTNDQTTRRAGYVDQDRVLAELKTKLEHAPRPNYISLAGSGEPTLHAGVGELIAGIKRLTRVPVAVLTNGSLLWDPDVRRALMEADLVMPSLDAGDETTFQQVNRPHPDIAFDAMVDGLAAFSGQFRRLVWLEVMLVDGINATEREVRKIAALARRIRPSRVQLNTVSRPPAEGCVRAVPAEQLSRLAQCFGGSVEIISDVGSRDPAGSWDDTVSDTSILALLSRRPCTADGVAAGLGLHIQVAAKRLDALAKSGAVVVQRRDEKSYYRLRQTPQA